MNVYSSNPLILDLLPFSYLNVIYHYNVYVYTCVKVVKQYVFKYLKIYSRLRTINKIN